MKQQITQISEDQMIARMDRDAKWYLKKYRPQMEALQSGSPLARHRRITMFDIVALGEQLQQFDNYKQFMNEAGSAGDLGHLPDLAFDIITAAYGTSVIPLLCSVQPIDEERGTIYFKQTKALNTRGNVAAGDVIRDPSTGVVIFPQGYAGERVTDALGATVAATFTYGGTLSSFPVRRNSVVFTNTLLSITASDDGQGNILGVGAQGTINYDTGAWTITFIADPGTGSTMAMTYGSDFESGNAIPKINTVTTSDSINAEIFVLSSEIGLFKSYSMKRRFGKVAEDELVQDLTNEITAEIGNTAISRMTAVAVGSEDWPKTPSAGVSWFEHKQELKDMISRAESRILTNAGRGVVNGVVCGPLASAILSNLPGFVKEAVSASGPQLYGTLDGVTVIRSPTIDESGTQGLLFPYYKGNGAFDAPIVYSPYMPLFLTDTIQNLDNILRKQAVAAVWAGLKTVVPAFMTRIRITP